MNTTSVMIVGVGGQGSLLASKLLGCVACDCGFDVKVSEVHGMSQRGGSVVTYVRFAAEVHSPIITPGEADYVVAFEKLEGARYAHYLKKEGVLLVNGQEIKPMPTMTGKVAYPSDCLDATRALGVAVYETDALALALSAGSAKAVNMVLMGCLAAKMPSIPKETWLKGIQSVVKPAFVALNLTAFELGYQAHS